MHTALPVAAGHGTPLPSAWRRHPSCCCRGGRFAHPLHPAHLRGVKQQPQLTHHHQQLAGGSRCAASSSSSSSSSSGDEAKHQQHEESGGGGVVGLLRRWQRDTQQLQQQLQSLGAAGVVAYGLFNTLYYTGAFLLVWFRFSDVGRGMGWAPVTQRAAEVFALVWAGSQVTKLLRAGAAVACAPLIERGLAAVGVTNKRAAYLAIVAGCIALALAVLGMVVLLHA